MNHWFEELKKLYVSGVGGIKRESGPEDDPGLSLQDRKYAG